MVCCGSKCNVWRQAKERTEKGLKTKAQHNEATAAAVTARRIEVHYMIHEVKRMHGSPSAFTNVFKVPSKDKATKPLERTDISFILIQSANNKAMQGPRQSQNPIEHG